MFFGASGRWPAHRYATGVLAWFSGIGGVSMTMVFVLITGTIPTVLPGGILLPLRVCVSATEGAACSTRAPADFVGGVESR